jgi:hypothetical protein
MSAYLAIFTFVVALFFPLWVPIAITVGPVFSNGLRRVRRAIA